MQVVQAAINVHGPTVLSWMVVVSTIIVGLTLAVPTEEASRIQRLACNQIHNGNTRLVGSI
jgi:hypothetical protein